MAKRTRVTKDSNSRSAGGRVERDVGSRGGFVFGRGGIVTNPSRGGGGIGSRVEVGGGVGVRFGGGGKKKRK